MEKAAQFATTKGQSLGQRWSICSVCVCVSCAQPLLLPLAIVSVCAGKLTAYLCRDPKDQQ
jgi:hypothetical protein